MNLNRVAMFEAIDKLRPENSLHFYNGWSMYPEWWNQSTESWQMGYKAREDYEKGTKTDSILDIPEAE